MSAAKPEIFRARDLARLAQVDPAGVTEQGVRVLADAVLELDRAASAGLVRRELFEHPKGERT